MSDLTPTRPQIKKGININKERYGIKLVVAMEIDDICM